MNGMIFAAGLGTRLRPLTDKRPKALVELNGKSLLQRTIETMKSAGITRIVVNIHHFADMVEEFLSVNNNFGIDILISDERELLLDTGGGLKKAVGLFEVDKPVLIHNVDIGTDLSLPLFMSHFLELDAYAMLVVKKTEADRVLKFNDQLLLKGWESKVTGEQKIVDGDFFHSSDYSFCGIQIVSYDYLMNIEHSGVFSIIDEHLFQARHHPIKAFIHSGSCIDFGTPDAFVK